MAVGVSYDDFWHGDPALVGYVIEAEEIRQKNRAIHDDFVSWNTGRYTMIGVGVVLSQAFSRNSTATYPAEPMLAVELDEALAAKKRERELIEARDGFLALAGAMMAQNAPKEYAVSNLTGEERPL